MLRRVWTWILLFLAPLISGCVSTPATGRKKLMGLIPIPFTKSKAAPDDPYAIWQEYAIYICVAGIGIGVVDYLMDRKITLIGPIIFACGLAVSIWGVTLGVIDAILPWALGIGLVGWVVLRYLKGKEKRNADATPVSSE